MKIWVMTITRVIWNEMLRGQYIFDRTMIQGRDTRHNAVFDMPLWYSSDVSRSVSLSVEITYLEGCPHLVLEQHGLRYRRPRV